MSLRDRVDAAGAWLVLAALGVVVTLDMDTLGAEAWRFQPGDVSPRGVLAPLVRAADRRWDPSLLRTAAMIAGVCVLALAIALALARPLPEWLLLGACVLVLLLLIVPGVALQAGLRQATAPWFFTNDSTYQIELAGDGLRHGHSPYGRDYSHTGLERFYSLDGRVAPGARAQHVALRHFAYFPGTALLAAAWRVLPRPWDDVRFLVALATLALFGAALWAPGPLAVRAALGVAAAGNPIAVRATWFGTADAPALFFLLLGFAAAARRRPALAGGLAAAAVLVKQFALAGVPFLAALVLIELGRSGLRRAAVAAAVVAAVGFGPFLAADPVAFWRDTISYGAGTYRIVGYGLSALLVKAHVLHDRRSGYPFLPLVVVVWIPATWLLVRAQLRQRSARLAGGGFAASVFLLLFLGRVFQISYLIWPLEGLVLAGLLAYPARRPT
jgi:glycosyl transferase family 87